MQRPLRLPRLYTTILMSALVLAPFYWLVFTEDGRRRTDLALLTLLGKPELNAALESFHDGLSEAGLRDVFPKLDLRCSDGANPFGNRLCVAAVGSFNGIPASSVTVFLEDDGLRAVRLSYRRAYHHSIRAWVEGRVGRLADAAQAGSGAQIHEGVVTWAVPDGLLVMRDGELARGDEPALLWLSRSALARRADIRVPAQIDSS